MAVDPVAGPEYLRPGEWKSSRIAVAVDDTGFQAAIAPSRPGIISGGVNTEKMNTSGKSDGE